MFSSFLPERGKRALAAFICLNLLHCDYKLNGSLKYPWWWQSLYIIFQRNLVKFCSKDRNSWVAVLCFWCSWNEAKRECITASLRILLHPGDSHRAKGVQEAVHRGEIFFSKILKLPNLLEGGDSWKILYLHRGDSHRTATSNARFWVWVHLLVNLVAMAFLFTMNLYLPWVWNFNLSQARLLKETACNHFFSVLVHGIPSIRAWISIHQNS